MYVYTRFSPKKLVIIYNTSNQVNLSTCKRNFFQYMQNIVSIIKKCNF